MTSGNGVSSLEGMKYGLYRLLSDIKLCKDV